MLTIHDLLSLFSRVAGIVVLLVAAGGCADAGSTGATGGNAGTGGDAGETGDGGVGGAGGVVDFLITVLEYAPIKEDGTISLDHPAAAAVPASGVKTCELNTNNCELTNTQGKVVLKVPADAEIAVSVEKEGYCPQLVIDMTDDTFPGDRVATLLSDAQATLLAQQIGVDYPFVGGLIGFVRLPSPKAGVTVSLVDADTAVGPYYFDTVTQRYRADGEETVALFADYDYPLGTVGFAQVRPGVRELELGASAGACTRPSKGWPSDTLNRVRVPVEEGFFTYASIYCD